VHREGAECTRKTKRTGRLCGAPSFSSPRTSAMPVRLRDESGRRLVGAPERGQRLSVRALAQLLEGAVADLADAFAGHAEQRADLFERPLLPVVETVVEVEDLALA